MHKLTLERLSSNDNSTGGALFLDGMFICFTCEDAHHEAKIVGETRIPAGTYRITLRNSGGLTKRYAARYPDIHKGMLWLRDVPGFEWIYIHVGNTHRHTEGCVLIGERALCKPGKNAVYSSALAYRRLYPILAEAAANDELEIEIIDRDKS